MCVFDFITVDHIDKHFSYKYTDPIIIKLTLALNINYLMLANVLQKPQSIQINYSRKRKTAFKQNQSGVRIIKDSVKLYETYLVTAANIYCKGVKKDIK